MFGDDLMMEKIKYLEKYYHISGNPYDINAQIDHKKIYTNKISNFEVKLVGFTMTIIITIEDMEYYMNKHLYRFTYDETIDTKQFIGKTISDIKIVNTDFIPGDKKYKYLKLINGTIEYVYDDNIKGKLKIYYQIQFDDNSNFPFILSTKISNNDYISKKYSKILIIFINK